MGQIHSSNDYELVIKSTKELEYILAEQFHAEGRGLHEKLSHCESQIPQQLVKKMRYLATIRNRLIHERGFDAIPDRPTFIKLFVEAENELKILLKDRNKSISSYCIIS